MRKPTNDAAHDARVNWHDRVEPSDPDEDPLDYPDDDLDDDPDLLPGEGDDYPPPSISPEEDPLAVP